MDGNNPIFILICEFFSILLYQFYLKFPLIQNKWFWIFIDVPNWGILMLFDTFYLYNINVIFSMDMLLIVARIMDAIWVFSLNMKALNLKII